MTDCVDICITQRIPKLWPILWQADNPWRAPRTYIYLTSQIIFQKFKKSLELQDVKRPIEMENEEGEKMLHVKSDKNIDM